MLYPTKGVSELTRFTPEKVEEKYGLTPQQYPDFAALRGDPSDNLPGIPGVGEKTAAKWINQFGSFEELVERADEVKGKAGQNLRDHLEAVKLNRRLTELVRDVELPKAPPDLERAPYDRDGADAVSWTCWRSATRACASGCSPSTRAPRRRRPPAPAAGVELDGTVLGAGELAPWLEEHGGAAARRGHRRHLGAGHRQRHRDRARRGRRAPPPGSTRRSWTRPTSGPSPPGSPTPDRPKVMHNAKGAMRVFPEHGWSVDGVTMDTALAAYLVKPGRRSFALDALVRRVPGP